MPKTRRSNEPYKRHHWHSARTERRNRFSTALKSWKRVRAFDSEIFLEPRDQDLQMRRGANVSRGHGRGGVSFEGERRPHVDWITADKSRIRYQLERQQIPLARASELERRLNL
ncbi:MAG: hypothetical protein QOE90_252 [Thermoplasmata archaeon]|jgi:hypothetical protein|nr:hypothetical protein [Thermoplasmata archaeon]